jgi:hypothetical protein
VILEFNLNYGWFGTNLAEGIKYWIENISASPQLPTYIYWNIWHERNKALFEDSNPSVLAMIYKTKASLIFKQTEKKVRMPRAPLIIQNSTEAIAWFDGATQMEGSKCGAGGIIKISKAEEYKWTFNCGNGSNTKAELLSA